MSKIPTLNLGVWRQLDGSEGCNALQIPAHHLVTHSVVLGMTGSGKTGFVTVLVLRLLGRDPDPAKSREHVLLSVLAERRLAMMRGPMTRNEILWARQWRASIEGIDLPRNSAVPPPMTVEMPESVRRPKMFTFADAEADL